MVQTATGLGPVAGVDTAAMPRDMRPVAPSGSYQILMGLAHRSAIGISADRRPQTILDRQRDQVGGQKRLRLLALFQFHYHQ